MIPISQDKIQWSDLIISANADSEIFSNMRIVTARSEFISKAQELALHQLYQGNKLLSDSEIDKVTDSIIKTANITVFESVSILDGDITVCINEDVIDDDTIWKALDMVYHAMNIGGNWTSSHPLVFDM